MALSCREAELQASNHRATITLTWRGLFFICCSTKLIIVPLDWRIHAAAEASVGVAAETSPQQMTHR